VSIEDHSQASFLNTDASKKGRGKVTLR